MNQCYCFGSGEVDGDVGWVQIEVYNDYVEIGQQVEKVFDEEDWDGDLELVVKVDFVVF